MSTEKPRIVVQDVLNLLKKGYTRYTKDNLGNGSIQEHYGLTGVEVKQLFLHAKLKARKTIVPKESLNIIDLEETSVETTTSQENLSLEEVVIGTMRTIVESEGQPVPSEISKEELFS